MKDAYEMVPCSDCLLDLRGGYEAPPNRLSSSRVLLNGASLLGRIGTKVGAAACTSDPARHSQVPYLDLISSDGAQPSSRVHINRHGSHIISNDITTCIVILSARN